MRRIFASILEVFEEDSSAADKSRPYKESFEGFTYCRGREQSRALKSKVIVLVTSMYCHLLFGRKEGELSHFRRLL